MAREAVKVEQYGQDGDGQAVRYTCASNAAIVKGTFLKFADGRVASASTGTGDMFAGFAATAKSATDLSTSISAVTNGIYNLTASRAIVAGDLVQTAVPGNYVIPLAANTSSKAIIVGVALDSVAATESVNVRVNL